MKIINLFKRMSMTTITVVTLVALGVSPSGFADHHHHHDGGHHHDHHHDHYWHHHDNGGAIASALVVGGVIGLMAGAAAAHSQQPQPTYVTHHRCHPHKTVSYFYKHGQEFKQTKIVNCHG